jgi:hypothetical protein
MGKIVILMVGLLLMVASGGCTSSEDASDVYVGTWVSEGGMYASDAHMRRYAWTA